MASVTGRIKEIKQPKGGYLPVKSFIKNEYIDGLSINEDINISPQLQGSVVDYLTRFLLGNQIKEAFDVSIKGAFIARKIENAYYLLGKISGIDEESIINACKLASYDVWYRNPAYALLSYGPDDVNPDKNTIDNIRTLVNRSLKFFECHGPVLKTNYNFEGGYTSLINSGDGDYLTKDGLWDLKVRKRISSSHTLQILMYWIMGVHSGQKEFESIYRIGIFNAYSNISYEMDILWISSDIINIVETDVIGYPDSALIKRSLENLVHNKCFEFKMDFFDSRRMIYSRMRLQPYIINPYSLVLFDYGYVDVSINREYREEKIESICRLAIINKVADIVETDYAYRSARFYLENVSSLLVARLIHFFMETEIIQKASNEISTDSLKLNVIYSLQDFINTQTGEFKPEYGEIVKEKFELDPNVVSICKY